MKWEGTMASAKNRVIAGAFDGKPVRYKSFVDYHVLITDIPSYSTDAYGLNSYSNSGLELTKNNVIMYESITEEKMKSGSSAIIRGAFGAAVLGPVGILAGLTAKNKGIHTVAIEWKNGKKSLIEVDEKIYKKLIADLF